MTKLLTTQEAAELIRRSDKTIGRMVADGRLPARRTHPGGPMLFREQDLLLAIGIAPDEPSQTTAPFEGTTSAAP